MRLEDTCYARFPLVCDVSAFLFKVRESIAELLILCLQIEVEHEYQKHVDERTRNRIVLQFGNL